MPKPTDRRAFLTAITAGAAGLAWVRAGRAQTAPPPLQATKLAADLIEISGDGGNVAVLTTEDGVLMVDGGLPDRSADLLLLMSEQTGGRTVRVLFNTH